MAECKQVDLQIGTEAQFETKKETLPVGTIVGLTDPIHEEELDSDLQTAIDSIPNRLDKPADNPTEDSVVKVSSTGEVSYKPLSEFGDSGLSLSDIYPIGSIYLSVNSTSPASLFGGTWEQIKDRFLLAAGDAYSAGLTGGEANHTLTENEMPSHKHGINTDLDGYGGVSPTGNYIKMKDNSAVNGYTSDTGVAYNGWGTSAAGGGASHNNMPPYLTVYMWKRVS